MRQLAEWLHTISGVEADILHRLLISLLIIALLWLLRRIAVRLLWRRTEDPHIRYRWQKVSIYITVTIGKILRMQAFDFFQVGLQFRV